MKPETIAYVLGRRMARLEDSRAWVWLLTILAATSRTRYCTRCGTEWTEARP